MQATINIDDQQLKSLMFHTHSKNESKAINSLFAASKATARLLALRGQVDIADNWQALRELEINK